MLSVSRPDFDADDRLAGLVRFHHGGAPRRDVVAERLGIVDAQEDGRRRQGRDSSAACPAPSAPPGRRRAARSGASRSPLTMASRRPAAALAMTVLTAMRRASLIVERGDDAVILQLELLIEREPRQRALLNDREGAEDGARRRDGQRNGKDQASRDRSKFEHGGCRSSARGRFGVPRNCLTTPVDGPPVLLRTGGIAAAVSI